jgi:HAD-superfamily hydrolase, subfamily IIB
MIPKIIFFDIDGTILSHRNFQILSSTKDAIRKAHENGHLTFINTGRTYAEIDEDIKNVGFDGYVCGCGTCIYYHSDVLYHTSIDAETKQSIIRDLQHFDIDAVLEGNSAIYFNSNFENETMRFVYDMYKNRKFNVRTWDDSDIVFEKFCIWLNRMQTVTEFRKKYEPLFDFIDRDSYFLEIVPKGCSKATGIEYLLNHLNIPYENAYALGDSANDYSMLRYVKNSIGMGNSEQLILDIVSYVTKDVDEDGVAHALKHFQII